MTGSSGVARREIVRLTLSSHFYLQGMLGLVFLSVLQSWLGLRQISVISLASEPVSWTLLIAAGAAYCGALVLTPQVPPQDWRPARPAGHVVLVTWCLGLACFVWILAVVTALTPADARAMVVLLWLGFLGPAALASVVLPPGAAWAPTIGLAMMAALLGAGDTTAWLELLVRWPLSDPADTYARLMTAAMSGTCLALAISLRLTTGHSAGAFRRPARSRAAYRPPG